MTDAQILEIFYNKIIPEVQKGKINCYFTLNIIFNLTIDNREISNSNELPYEGILIPTLKITNKQLFDNLLIEYVKKAMEFYEPSNFSFLNDIYDIDSKNISSIKQEYLIKYIIGTLFANASIDDFNNPIEFLRSRISMFDNKILNSEDELELGYLDSIGAKIYVKEEKSPINTETPYRIKSYLEFDDGYKLLLPEIYVGNNGNRYQLYAIQRTNKNNEWSDVEREFHYLKQIRKGLVTKIKGAPEHYFLTVMLLMSLCSDKEIEIITFLVARWNAKRIAIYNKTKVNPNLSILSLETEQERIQNNITDIFIRYFTKLESVSNGIEFNSIPFEENTNFKININPNFESRSQVFNELFKLTNEYQNQKNK